MYDLAKALAEPDEAEAEAAPEDDMADVKTSAAQDMIDAQKTGDAKALADAFSRLMSACQDEGYSE
jgi:hypothetical protein